MDFAETDWLVQQSQGERFVLFTNNSNGCYTTVTVNGHRQQVQSLFISCVRAFRTDNSFQTDVLLC